MSDLTPDEKTVLELIKKYNGIGISEINKKTNIPLTELYTILLKLSIKDQVTFKKDGQYGIAGGVP